MALVRGVEGNVEVSLSEGWQCVATVAGAFADPSDLERLAARWFDAGVPGTAASSLAAASAWSLEDHRDFDAEDWWYRVRVPAGAVGEGRGTVLRLHGLATLADVWIDGVHVLRSENMFVGHALDVTGRLRTGSEIAIRFGSVAEELRRRRPRPRWRTQLVAQQQLRWVRTTLLGRASGWTPPATPVGPWRPVTIESLRDVRVVSADVRSRVEQGVPVCEARVDLLPLEGEIQGAVLRVGDAEVALVCERSDAGSVIARGAIRLPHAAPWWPSTHGEPALHAVTIAVQLRDRTALVDLGRTGFRSVDVDQDAGAFTVRINGVEVFCRGAVWTPLDVVGLGTSPAAVRSALGLVRDGGMNMLRLSGAMVDESPAFHDACDEMGILVWHDFMFANMDYPASDEGFARSVREEASQLVGRLQLSPSLALMCGGSEVEQQASMLGLARDQWSNPMFDELLPGVVHALRPDVPYVASSPSGGALPFRVDTGVSHYYGVGAYRRTLDDARRSRVRFTSECLGFANVPSAQTLEELGADSPSQPLWKKRGPRDRGTSWDFDDVRDHYLALLFRVDPADLRTSDLQRYLELGRLASGEAMAGAMSEWRRAGSECRGALVWFLRDLWPGAGWGVIDAHGRPKAAYYFLKRTLQPVTVLATDEGLNGLSLHVVNDSPRSLDARLKLALYRGAAVVAQGESCLTVPSRSALAVEADAILGRFVDTTYAYRFGPSGHDVAVATLEDATGGERVAHAFHFPGGLPTARTDPGLVALAEPTASGDYAVTLRSRGFAQAVAFDVRGFIPDDDFFHVEPGGERRVLLRRASAGSPAPFSARVLPANASIPTRVIVQTVTRP